MAHGQKKRLSAWFFKLPLACLDSTLKSSCSGGRLNADHGLDLAVQLFSGYHNSKHLGIKGCLNTGLSLIPLPKEDKWLKKSCFQEIFSKVWKI